MPKKRDLQEEAAFSLSENDRLHSIISSGGIRYDEFPDHETVMTFFAIRRASGLHDIIHVIKTFRGDECVSRQVKKKQDIPSRRIEQEIAAIRHQFSKAIQDATGLAIKWDTLDLSTVTTMAEQVAKIHAWGRVGVRVTGDIPPINLN